MGKFWVRFPAGPQMKTIPLSNINTLENEHGNIKSSLRYFLKFDFKKSVKVLDIGCNYGSLIFNIYNFGYHNIYGVDINSNNIAWGQKKYKIISSRLSLCSENKLPFQNKHFDIVLMFDIIEHIPNIQDYLIQQVYRVLKTNGILLFQTPNKLINIPWVILKNKSITKYKENHCSLQVYSSLKKILEIANFKDITIEKNNVLTKYNKAKVNKSLGFFGIILLYLVSKLPLIFYPNFWGSCKK